MKCPRCGWENSPDSKKCLQCDADLLRNKEISLYPPRTGKKSKFVVKRLKGVRSHKNEVEELDVTSYLRRYSKVVAKFVVQRFPTYLDIVLITIGGFVPGLVHFLQRRKWMGILFIVSFLLLVLILLITFNMLVSDFVLILMALLLIYSSYDAVNHYFEVKKLLLNIPVRIGIAVTSVSFFFLFRALILIFLNIFFIRATIMISNFEPNFIQGEQVFGIYSKFYRGEYQRGDFVLFKSPSYYRVTTIGRIVGKPMEKIEVKYNNVYVNGSILLPMDYQLVKMPDNINQTFVSDSTHFVVITYTPNGIFEQIPKDNIIAKILCVISPIERRRIIR